MRILRVSASTEGNTCDMHILESDKDFINAVKEDFQDAPTEWGPEVTNFLANVRDFGLSVPARMNRYYQETEDLFFEGDYDPYGSVFGTRKLYFAFWETDDVYGRYNFTYVDISDLFRKSDFIATKLWSREDVAACLEEKGYEGTEEETDEVINTGFLKHLHDCTDEDWETIYQAIDEAKRLGHIIPKEV